MAPVSYPMDCSFRCRGIRDVIFVSSWGGYEGRTERHLKENARNVQSLDSLNYMHSTLLRGRQNSSASVCTA